MILKLSEHCVYLKYPYFIDWMNVTPENGNYEDLIVCNNKKNPNYSRKLRENKDDCLFAVCQIEREFALKVFDIIGSDPEKFFMDNIGNYDVFNDKAVCVRQNQVIGNNNQLATTESTTTTTIEAAALDGNNFAFDGNYNHLVYGAGAGNNPLHAYNFVHHSSSYVSTKPNACCGSYPRRVPYNDQVRECQEDGSLVNLLD